MPLFTKKSDGKNEQKHENNNLPKPVLERPTAPLQEPNVGRPQLVFHCQLAHGSPTGLISGFSNVRELYGKIAEVFDMPASEVWVFYLVSH